MLKEVIEPSVGLIVYEDLFGKIYENEIIKVSPTAKTFWIKNKENNDIQKCTLRKSGEYKTVGECGSLVILKPNSNK